MQILTDQIEKVFFAYPVEKLCDASKILFIDIETTGFTAKSSNLYLIGCVYFNSGIWYTKQFFAENYSEEAEIITEFFEFAKDYTYLIHFNGNNFDLPYITQKCKDLNLPYNFDSFEGLDIYKRVAPYKEVLKIENCKQKTLESFLKIERKDEMGGGDLIGVYHHFVESGDEEARRLLLLHNRDDIAGMLKLLPILSYVDLFNENIHVTKVSANYYKDYTGKDRSELIMSFDCPSIILTPVTIIKGNLYMTASGNQGLIKVPIYEEEMKYFYANYRDYYYLPSEDQALHKSVASFVDKEHRIKATPATCYTRKSARFLPEWDAVVTPFFKREYNSKELFFEITKERQTDRELFNRYASHILNHLAEHK